MARTVSLDARERGTRIPPAAWLNADDLAAQKSIAGQIQRQIWQDCPHVPLGKLVPHVDSVPLESHRYSERLSGLLFR